MMKARDIMSGGAECVSASDTLETAARHMAKKASERCRSAATTIA